MTPSQLEEIDRKLSEIMGRLERLEWAVLSPAQKESWGTYYPSDPEFTEVLESYGDDVTYEGCNE